MPGQFRPSSESRRFESWLMNGQAQAVETALKQPSYPSTRKALAHTLLIRGCGFALGIGNSIVVARGLGAEGRGHLSVLLTAAMFLGLLCGPFSASNTILLGRDPRRLRTLIQHSAIAALLALLAILGLYLLLPGDLAGAALGIVSPQWTWLLFGLLGLQILSGSLQGLLLGRQEFYFSNYLSFGNGVLTLVLNVVLIVGLGWDVTGALLALIAAWAAVAGLSLWRLRGMPEWSLSSGRISPPLFSEGLSIGLRAIASNFPSLLMLRSDIFLVQRFLGPAPVGIYTVAVNVAEMILIVGSALNTIAFAKAASEQSSEASVIRSAKFSLLVSLGFWLFLGVTSWAIFPLAYGAEFQPAVMPCLVVMAGVCAWAFATPLAGYIVGKSGYPRAFVIATWAGFIVNLLLNLLLINRYGIGGAALATALAYTLTAAITLRIFAKMTRHDLKQILVPDTSDWRVIVQGYLSLKERYWALR
jgi:O-antigen/teichoic acid export membrane protein